MASSNAWKESFVVIYTISNKLNMHQKIYVLGFFFLPILLPPPLNSFVKKLQDILKLCM